MLTNFFNKPERSLWFEGFLFAESLFMAMPENDALHAIASLLSSEHELDFVEYDWGMYDYYSYFRVNRLDKIYPISDCDDTLTRKINSG